MAEAAAALAATFETASRGVVLRRIEEAARELRALAPDNRRAFLDFLERVIRGGPQEGAPAEVTDAAGPPLIIT